ncbi:NADH-quinone oxidoreductase subunit C [[Collinsella] massiliensis]|uniref:NADH:ubiquinone oxidoreductase 30kDa subunit domain-containing protein n=1 Tax=[Collinsella] massiliensis TaxID=1232426 RepID=A0A1Y3Y5U3_9ACTN|nr:NADH-quinone oxidoreductase subunit C [[Collinsella] massiliensis]OUN89690.1 hypothetical protein B5G02_01260 [[Collinsella] massiliensis]
MYTTEFVEIPLGELLCRVQTLKHEGLRFVQMCAETTEAGIDLLYTFYDETCDNALNLCVYGIDHDSEVPSIQGLYFAAFSYENETHDLYGVKFINMQLDFGGNFFNVATDEPMTIISPEMKAEREKLAKQKAAAAAKARKAAEAAQAAEADAAAGEKAAAEAAGARAGAVADKADPAAGAATAGATPAATATGATPAAAAPASGDAADDRAAKMEAKLAAMDPEKAAKVRAALAARAAKAVAKDGE